VETLIVRFVVVDPLRRAPELAGLPVRVEEIPAGHPALPPPALLRRGGAPAVLLDRLARGPHLLVSASYGPGWPPRHLFDTVAYGSELAAATGGILLDPLLARVVSPEASTHLPSAREDFVPQHFIRISASPAGNDLEMVTTGLSRLGLPELRTVGLAPYLGQAWAKVTAALSYRLLQEIWGGAEDLPVELLVTAADLAAVTGEESAGEMPVRLEPTVGPCLTLRPRAGVRGPEGFWHRETVMTLFPRAWN
jgi:hypothetical protein